MQPLECRFRISRALGESGVIILMTFILATLAGGRVLEVQPPLLLGVAAGVCILLVGALLWGRWRSRFVVHDQGVEFRRSERSVVTRIAWDEIEELFLLDDTHFEIRGAGRQIRLAGPYEDLYGAREACLPRMQRIREHLQARALRDGTVTFRMPGGRWHAHLAYFAAVLVLTGITSYCLYTMLSRKLRNGVPFILLFFGGSWLWGLRKRASGLGTRVILTREGFVVRRLDGRDKVPWEELERTEWNERNGINLVLRSRRVLVLPPSLGNIGLLEEFLHEGRRAVDSQARGEAEGRTMLQSP